MENSDCCSAGRWNDTDLCDECREHADFTEEEIITAKEYLRKNRTFSEELNLRIAMDIYPSIPFMYKREDLIEFAEAYNKELNK